MADTAAHDGLMGRQYQIGGITYRLEPLSWQQHQWLAEQVFRDVDVRTIDYGAIHDIGRRVGPLFMAICLLAEGQTRKQKSQQDFAAIRQLADEFRGELDGQEVAIFCTHFFFFCRPGQMTMLVPGRVLQELFLQAASEAATPVGGSSPAPGGNGSNLASSSSATETAPWSSASGATGDQLTPSRISAAVLSDVPLITPSSDGVASSCPG